MKALFVIKKAFFGGALFLMNMDKEELSQTINVDKAKKYYT